MGPGLRFEALGLGGRRSASSERSDTPSDAHSDAGSSDADTGSPTPTPGPTSTPTPIVPTPTPTPDPGSVEIDREALMALHESTQGDTKWWKGCAKGQCFQGWDDDTPLSQWTGISTNSDGRVTQIHLGNFGLEGPIPAELGNMTQLKRLGLWSESEHNQEYGRVNKLSGEIPEELGNLTHLYYLDLSGNYNNANDGSGLTGEIPAELGNLSNLESLILKDNKPTGEIPEELGDLGKLESLALDNNQLSGEIPTSLAYLNRLMGLRLQHNQLTGTIDQAFGRYRRIGMQVVDFCYNYLDVTDAPNFDGINGYSCVVHQHTPPSDEDPTPEPTAEPTEEPEPVSEPVDPELIQSFDDVSISDGASVEIEMTDHFVGTDLTYEVYVTTVN